MDQQEFEIYDGIVVPAAALRQEQRRTRYGNLADLSDEELADPDELERVIYKEMWWPILRLPQQRWECPIRPNMDEDGRVDWGALGTVDFESYRPQSSKLRYKAEQVIRRGYLAIPQSEPETALISDRKITAALGLDDVISQIRKRYEVYDKNIEELEWSKCEAINCLYRHEGYHGPTDGKIEYSVSKRMNELYMEQRAERVNLWRDVSRLRLELPENAQQYLSAYRKVAILEDNKGDAT